MKYIVFSDSHGRRSYMEAALEKEQYDGIIFLGDGSHDMDEIEKLYWNKAIIRLSGNCDLGSQYPNEQIAATDGVTFLATHGNRYSVKYDVDALAYHASQLGVSVVLFGHTHSQLLRKYQGILLLNPGTIGLGDYAMISFKDGKAEAELKSFDE